MLAASLSAQDRGRVSGIVRDLAGKPWANARVVLNGRAAPFHPRDRDADVVRATSDARGRFHAEVLRGRAYSAWATAAVEGGSYRVSQIAERVVAGSPLRLRERGTRGLVADLSITGLGAWKAHAPIHARVWAHEPSQLYDEPVRIDRDGHATLPALPGAGCFLELRGINETPVGMHFVPLTAQRRGKKTGPIPIDVRPPRTLRLRIVHADTKTPLANVDVLHDMFGARCPWYRLGRTAKDGIARLVLPGKPTGGGSADFGRVHFVVRGNTVRDTCAIFDHLTIAPAPGNEFDLEVSAAEGVTVRGRVLLTEGEPARHLPLLLYSSLNNRGGGGQIGIGPWYQETDDDGRFVIGGRASNYGYRLCALPRAQHRARIATDRKFPLCPELILDARQISKATDLGDIRIDELAHLDLDVVGPDGARVDRPVVLVSENKGNMPHYPLRALADRRGRLRVLVPAELPLVVFASAPNGSCLRVLPRAAATELAFSDKRRIRGRVFDGNGRGVASVRVQCACQRVAAPPVQRWRTIRMLTGTFLSKQPPLYYGADTDAYWRFRHWNWFTTPHDHVMTDRQGNFSVFVPADGLEASLTVIAGPDRDWRKGDVFRANPGTEAIELQLPGGN